MESPDLFSRGHNLLRRQDEAIPPCVPQLHAYRELDVVHPLGPVQTALAGHVQHAGNATNLVGLAVGIEQGLGTCNRKYLTLHMEPGKRNLTFGRYSVHPVVVIWPRATPPPGQEDELRVAVDVVVHDELACT